MYFFQEEDIPPEEILILHRGAEKDVYKRQAQLLRGSSTRRIAPHRLCAPPTTKDGVWCYTGGATLDAH